MPTFLPSRAVARGCWLFLMMMAAQVQAQELSFAEQQALMAQQARQSAMEQIRSGALVLEGALDADAYRVGPGDVFVIGIGGALAEQRRVTVTADGMLIVPEGGSFPVAGLSLAEARERVTTGLRRIYRNVSLQVALVEPRQFYVHVSGDVERPGRHAVVPIARVEDAIAAGMRDRSPLLALRERRQQFWAGTTLPALRNIEVRRADGTVLRVDLLSYYATGDLVHNPYLLDGDAVFVPSVERGGPRMVYVEREGEGIGTATERLSEGIDYREGDTLTTLLRIEGGEALVAHTDRVRLLRADAGGRLRTEEVDVAAIRNGAPDRPIHPRDRILIPRIEVERGTASVIGFVRFPGTYPVIENQTTLRELIEAAGGLRPEGLLRGAYLERRGAVVTQADREREGATQVLDPSMSPEQRVALLEMATFENARLSDLPFGSRQYMVREMLQFQRVSLDLGDDPSAIPDVPLRDGDRLVVPRDPQAVLVVGQVRHPGYVAYRAGADATYYIAQAGGRGPAATETYVREAGSGYFRFPDGRPIRSGDALFVDRETIADTEALQALALQEQQLAFQREQERRTGRLQLAQLGLTVISTGVAIVTTYLLATRD